LKAAGANVESVVLARSAAASSGKYDCSQNVIFLTFGRDRALYPSIGIKT